MHGAAEGILSPALKFFPTQQSPIGRAVHQSSLSEDIYLILSGFSEVDRNHATLKVLVRPLVIWMWIGGFVIPLGTLVCILPMGKNKREDEALQNYRGVKLTCLGARARFFFPFKI